MPGHTAVIIAGKVTPRGFQCQGLALPMGQHSGFCKGAQHFGRFPQPPLRRGAVELHNFLAGAAAGILDGSKGGNAIGCFICAQQPNFKFCIGKAKAKGIKHLFRCKRFKIAVADVNIFGIDVAVIRPVMVSRRIICQCAGDGIGQFAAGVDGTVQHIQHTAAAFLPALPDVRHRAGVVSHDPLHINDIANIQQHHRFFEMTANQRQHIFLAIGQQKAAGSIAIVLVFPCRATDDNKRRFGTLGRSADKVFIQRHFWLKPRFLCPAGSHLVRVFRQPCCIAGLHLSIQLVAVRTAQHFGQVRHVGGVHQPAGPCAALVVVKLRVPK